MMKSSIVRNEVLDMKKNIVESKVLKPLDLRLLRITT
jgi:hypothetical protein